jgi:aminocarboxymuconate-semialdehyde decarboxylase
MLRAGLATAAVAALGRTSTAQTSAPGLQASGVRTVDIHAHYYSKPYLELIKSEGARFNSDATVTDQSFGFKTPAGTQPALPMKFIDLKQRLADMDAQGIAVQALSLTTPMVYFADGEVSHKLARQWNDDASAAHKAHPDRFVVLATLPMLDADRAVDELNRASQLPGVRGVYMGTNINGRDLDDPLFQPIFARVEALDLPVFLHPLQTIGGQRLGAYYLNNLLGNPYDTAIAASRLIFGGVLDRHPRLQVNLPHSGGALPILIGRIDHGWKVRKETKHLGNAPSSYLRRFTYDTISHSKPIMEFVISQVGVDRIMIGSDYCFDMGYERPVQVVEELGLGNPEKQMILGGNAARILKLPV